MLRKKRSKVQCFFQLLLCLLTFLMWGCNASEVCKLNLSVTPGKVLFYDDLQYNEILLTISNSTSHEIELPASYYLTSYVELTNTENPEMVYLRGMSLSLGRSYLSGKVLDVMPGESTTVIYDVMYKGKSYYKLPAGNYLCKILNKDAEIKCLFSGERSIELEVTKKAIER